MFVERVFELFQQQKNRHKRKKKNHEINKQNKFPKIRQNHDDVFAATATK